MLVGCGKNSVEETKKLNSNNPLLKVKKSALKVSQKERLLELNNTHILKIEELKVKKELNLASIVAQKEQKLKELELQKETQIAKSMLQKAQVESNKTITVAKINSSKEVKLKEQDSSLYKVASIIVALILIFFAILKYLSTLSKRRQELELKERELQHQAYMEDIKSKHQHISKMLDIISDEKSDKEIKKSMTKLLERGKGNILEHK
jgi:hypothetical protein